MKFIRRQFDKLSKKSTIHIEKKNLNLTSCDFFEPPKTAYFGVQGVKTIVP